MQPNQINVRRIFVIAGVTSLSIIYLLLWVQMIVDPAQRTGTDFIAFFAAGRVVQESGFSHAYDVALQQRIQQDEVGFQLAAGQALPYLHMPYLLPLLGMLVSNDYIVSFLRWVILLLGVYAGGLVALTYWFSADTPDSEKRIFLLGAATFFPCFVSLLLGQDSAFLFLGVALLGWGVIRQKDWLAGIGLALMTVRPHLVLLLALPFLFSRRGVFRWFLALAGTLAAISVALLGLQGTRDFINILMISASGEGYGTKEIEMYNLIGLLSRLFSRSDPVLIRLIGWMFYLAAILGLCILAARAGQIDERRLSLMLLITILVVPHFHYHDLVLLIFPLLMFQQQIGSSASYRKLRYALQPLSVSFLLLLGASQKDIGFILPYLIIILLVLMHFQWEARRHWFAGLPSELYGKNSL